MDVAGAEFRRRMMQDVFTNAVLLGARAGRTCHDALLEVIVRTVEDTH